jgi:RNA polymerase sigma-70 factor, ECF subfamily
MPRTTVETSQEKTVGPRSDRGFAAFYEAESPGVLALLYSLVGLKAVAEDLAQEAFLRAYRDWHAVGEHPRPDAWVRTVAVNLARSRFRRLAAEARALTRLSGRGGTETPAALSEESERFWAAVRRLPARQAQAVALHYADDQSVADIARIMGCAEGTVKAHLHQARMTLARHLPVPQEGAP